MKNRFLPYFLLLSLLLLSVSGCRLSLTGSGTDSQETADMQADCTITFSGKTASFQGSGAAAGDGEIVIARAGVYRLCGSLTDTTVVIKAGEQDDITLLLDGVRIENSNGPALKAESAASLRILAETGTENTLSSGNADELEDNAEEDNSGSALRSVCPVSLGGSGALAIYGYTNNGIKSDGDLTLSDLSLTVVAANDCIKSEGDVLITSGSYTLTALHDGIQCTGSLTVEDGIMDIVTGGGSSAADIKTSDSAMMGGMGGMGGGGRPSVPSGEPGTEGSGEAESESSGEVISEEKEAAAAADAETEKNSSSHEIRQSSGEFSREMGSLPMPGFSGEFSEERTEEEESVSDSAKGLKSDGDILLTGGSITLDCRDDAIHAGGSIAVEGGTLTIASGDDGIHADSRLDIRGGSINITLSYEGLEGTIIAIEDGVVDIVAVDDGMNAFGNNGFGFGGAMRMPGASGETSSEASIETESETPETSEEITEDAEEGPLLRISGGSVTVNSGGDGLDSNGDLYIRGGTVYVSGPATDWDAAIDSGEGCEFSVTGGTLMAAGYSGMAETPESTEDAQCSLCFVLDEAVPAGTEAVLRDADGNTVLQYSFANEYNCLILSSPDLILGESYTLSCAGTEYTLTLESVTASNITRGFGGMGGRP